MKNKFYLNLIIYSFVIYCFITAIGKIFTARGEIFPFFHWGLYVTTPQDISKNDIIIYNNKNGVPISFFEETSKKIGITQTRNLLRQLKDCQQKQCFAFTLNTIKSYIPNGSCAIYYSYSSKKTDTIGYIYNGKLSKISCLK